MAHAGQAKQIILFFGTKKKKNLSVAPLNPGSLAVTEYFHGFSKTDLKIELLCNLSLLFHN